MPTRTPKTTAAPWLPDGGGLVALQRASQECRGCDLWRDAEQALGRSFRVTVDRGVWIQLSLAPQVLATVHPASILRAPDEAARAEAVEALIRDLRLVSDLLASAEIRSASPGP